MKKQKTIAVLIFMVLLLNSCEVFLAIDVEVPKISVDFRNNTNETLLIYTGSYGNCPDTILRGRLYTATIRKGQAIYIYGAVTGKQYVAHNFYGYGYYVIDGF